MSAEQTFWARRRAGVVAESQAEDAALEARALSEQHAALEDLSDDELLIELDLPNPNTLKMGDDFTAFLAKAVPDRIRRRALRTLWRSNPVLANVDMLVDYGEDFTDSATVIENMQTTYQVGKGMLKHLQEMARQAEEQENPPRPEEIDEEIDDDGPPLAALEEGESNESAEVVKFVPEDEEPYVVSSPRRMKFRNEETA